LAFLAEDLNVPRRRIYDIVNILEGINLVYKDSPKNLVHWIGPRVQCVSSDGEEWMGSSSSSNNNNSNNSSDTGGGIGGGSEASSIAASAMALSDFERLWRMRLSLFENETEIAKLRLMESELSQCIPHIQLGVRSSLTEANGAAFVSKEDIMRLPLFRDQTVMAIKVRLNISVCLNVFVYLFECV
jgi:hypothetical protein